MRPHQNRNIPPHRNSDHRPSSRRLGEFLIIPFTLALAPTIGVLVGWYLDRRLGTFPALTIVLLVLGFSGGVREVWRSVKRSESTEDRSE